MEQCYKEFCLSGSKVEVRVQSIRQSTIKSSATSLAKFNDTDKPLMVSVYLISSSNML